MGKDTKKRILIFLFGLTLVSFLTIIGTLAFFEADLYDFVRNIVITDMVFVILYVVWIKLHKGYETIYRSGFTLEDKK
ncbi:hypothetical protein HYV85_06520 [Candidatus Woesearchaeota archaeon]|nr:hypothetical protein [Candidatus Woesearchaeota archaeon]